jgi:hypothetical protein
MSRSLFERRYGFGAGRVPLCPAQHSRRVVRSFREVILEARRDGDAVGHSLAQIARASAAFVAAALLLAFVFADVLTLPPDESEIVIVAFVEPFVEEPSELPPLPEPEPEPVPVERAKPEPLPSVDDIAALAPSAPATAKPPPPKPPPPAQAKPLPPSLQIQQIARAPEAAPLPQRRVSRDPRAKPTAAPRLTFDPLPLPDVDEPRTQRAARSPLFSAARPPDAKPRFDAPALRTAPAALAPSPARPARRNAPSPERSRPAPPRLAVAASSPAPPGDRPPPRRETRRTPALPAPRRGTRNKLALAISNAGPDPPAPARPTPVRQRAGRTAPAPAASPRAEEPGVRGVPLASLAACVSDRLEDTLKQKVVAAARDRAHCESPEGRYHFVETKNVNAFLMGIERRAQRKPGDRCAELAHALDCLSRRDR